MDDDGMTWVGRPPAGSEVEMVELVLPNDANPLGNCLGGRVMYLIDIAGGLAAARHCRQPVVTASMDHLDFLAPVKVGDALILRARVNYAAHTSMEVEVQVFAENLCNGEQRHTSTAYLTFVALGGDGRPAAVPPVAPASEEDRRRFREAEVRRGERLRRLGRLAGEAARPL